MLVMVHSATCLRVVSFPRFLVVLNGIFLLVIILEPSEVRASWCLIYKWYVDQYLPYKENVYCLHLAWHCWRSHEDMSYRLVDYIVDEHNIEMDDGMLKKVKVDKFSYKLYLLVCFFFLVKWQRRHSFMILCCQIAMSLWGWIYVVVDFFTKREFVYSSILYLGLAGIVVCKADSLFNCLAHFKFTVILMLAIQF